MATYQQSVDRRGLRLRPGISLEQITVLLTALVEGTALPMIADSNAESLIDHEQQWSLFGLARQLSPRPAWTPYSALPPHG
jgi:hypothetical protein